MCVHDMFTMFKVILFIYSLFLVLSCRYYLRESKGSKRWLLYLEGEDEW